MTGGTRLALEHRMLERQDPEPHCPGPELAGRVVLVVALGAAAILILAALVRSVAPATRPAADQPAAAQPASSG